MTGVNPLNGGGDDPRLPVQPRNYLRPCLLLLLAEEPTYGYEVREKLGELSPSHWDPGTVYRTLNTMEDDGLVRSTWERSAEGPRRRLYEITDAGDCELGAWARELCGMRNMIIEFIGRYESRHHEHAPLPEIPWHAMVALQGLGPEHPDRACPTDAAPPRSPHKRNGTTQ